MSSSRLTECYVSVDVEAAGPSPCCYSMLSIGACLVHDPEQHFYIELQPLTLNAVPAAMDVHHLSLERLARAGVPPAQAMARFADWLASVVPDGQRPIFVSFNAAFDWMFVNDYFHRFLGHNPFGHSALDIKAFYMGLSGRPWSETSMRWLPPRYMSSRRLQHHSLQDAIDQAGLFRQLLAETPAHCEEVKMSP
jgi:DNA polymerase III epsilon subunit-like protein